MKKVVSKKSRTKYALVFHFVFLMALIVVSVFSYENTAFAASRQQELTEPYVVVIDPGHGGDNLGTETGWELEKEMTMTTALAMAEELRKYENIQVILTRDDDTDLSLKDRALLAAAEEADFLFSIHYNASVHHDLYGSEVWISVVPPFNSYGYQFGTLHMQTMEEMGIPLRGVKSKYSENNNGDDYYGILRNASELNVPAVIIEHCHVDIERDAVFADTDSKLKAFGKADATSVAKYLGLKSDILGVDYTDYPDNELALSSKDSIQVRAMQDITEPEECSIELMEADYDGGNMGIKIYATDMDGMILSYATSYDGGATFSERLPWLNANTYLGTYATSMDADIVVPQNVLGQLVVRVFNQYDLCLDSNVINLKQVVRKEELVDITSVSGAVSDILPSSNTDDFSSPDGASSLVPQDQELNSSGNSMDEVITADFTDLFQKEETLKAPDFKTFLLFALFIVGVVILILLTIALFRTGSSGRRRR